MRASYQLPIRVMLLDDHPIVRQGFVTALKSAADILVVGNFTTGRELMFALAVSTAHVLLIDYALGPGDIDGINLIRALRIRFPNSAVLVVSGHYTTATVALALRAGAHGFLGKTQPVEDLAKAIRTVAIGKCYLDPVMAAYLDIENRSFSEAVEVDGYDDTMLTNKAKLSPREREVLRCVMDGMSVTEIALKFSRSVNTISTQKQAALRKLGVRNDTELFKVFHQSNAV